MARKIVNPPINATGIYSTYEPFQVSLEIVYRCTAIRTFPELKLRNIDPYEEYYEPKGLGEDIYADDAAMGAAIVILESSDGVQVGVPNTYIESYPGMAAIVYERKLVLMDLGPLPSTLDPSYLIPEIKDVIRKRCGVDEDVSELEFTFMPMTTPITHEQHIELEKSRRAAIQQNQSLEEANVELRARNDQLSADNELLMQVIAQYPELGIGTEES